MKSDERLVYVSLPYATFLLCIDQGRIVDAPPIASWAIGLSERKVASYYRAKGARFTEITE